MIKKLVALLEEVLGLGDDALKEARRIHAFYVSKIIVGFLLLLATAVFFNYIGWPGFSLWAALSLTGFYLFLATRPEPWLVALGLIEISKKEVETTEDEKKAGKGNRKPIKETYIRPAFQALFWLAVILLVISKISVKANPQAVLTGLVAAIIIISYVIGFEVKFAIARRLLYAFACVMMIVSLLQVSGLDMFTSNPTEIGVSNIESKAEKARQERNAKMLRVIEIKAEQSGGKPLDEVLSPEELQLFVNLSKQRDARSLKSKLSSLFEHREAKAALAPPPPPPLPLKEKRTAVLPATPPPPQTPIVVTPNPLPPPEHKVPDWKVTEEGVNYGVFHKMTLRSTVEFSRDRETVTIHQQYGNWYIFKGKRVGKFRYEGTWQDEFPRDQYYYWGEFGIEFAPDMQSACGWKTTRDDADNRVKTVWEYIPRQ